MNALFRAMWVVLCCFSAAWTAPAPPPSPQYAAIVVDANTGKTIFARNADASRYPASLTKMMTLYLLFEALEKGQLRLTSQLPVSHHAQNQPPCKIYLKAGTTISVRDAILALAVKSANDVAVVVAEALGKSEQNFAQMMTRKAHALGMRATTFGNASGLPKGHRHSTARDLAKLAHALHKNFPQFYHYFGTKEFRYKGNVYRNHNKLVGTLDGCDGLKTGFTNAAGSCLAASLTREGQRVFAVVLGCRSQQSRNDHMRDLLLTSMKKASRVGPNMRKSIGVNAPVLTAAVLQKPVALRSPRDTLEALPPRITALKKPPGSASRSTPKSPVAATKAIVSRGVTIQVGAFSDTPKAVRHAKSLQNAVPILKNTQIVIVPTGPQKKIHQARLRGLTPANAARACAQLKQRKNVCVILK